MDNLLKRCGRFRISYYLIRTDTAGLLKLFGQMVVVKAEANFHHDYIEYVAYSPLFEEIAEGAEVPLYTIDVGVLSAKASRVR